MATNDPMAGIQGILGLVQAKAMLDQMEMQRHQQAIQGYQQFTTLLGNTIDPDQQAGLIQTFTKLGYNPETLTQLAKSVAPDLDVIQGFASGQGYRNAAPEQRAELEAAGAARTIAGQDVGGVEVSILNRDLVREGVQNMPSLERQALARAATIGRATGQDVGSYAQAQTYSDLPDFIRSRGEEIRLGTELSAPDLLRDRQFLQDIEFRYQNLRDDTRLREMALALQEMGLDLDLKRMAAQQVADSGLDPGKLLDELGRNIRSLAEAPDDMPAAARDALGGSINQHIRMLTDMGILPPRTDAEGKPMYVTDPRTGEQHPVPVQYSVEELRNRGWKWRNVVIPAAGGAAIGGMLGGPPGAAIGATVGGAGGSAINWFGNR